MSDQTLTITAREFAELVAPVRACAGTDDMLPVLNTVRFEVRNGYLLAMATDRFRMAVHRKRTDIKAFTAILPLAELDTIMRIFRPHQRGVDPEITLTICTGAKGDLRLRVERADGLTGFDFIDASVSVSLLDEQYPDILKLVRDTMAEVAPEALEPIAVNPNMLADWRVAAKRHQPIVMRMTHPNKPLLVTAGDDFIGLQMPVRRTAAEEGVVPWSHTIAEKPARKRAAAKKRAS